MSDLDKFKAFEGLHDELGQALSGLKLQLVWLTRHLPSKCRRLREKAQTLSTHASGKQVSQIARELSLSVKTISTYRAGVLQKTDLKNNAELTRYAVERGLV